MIHAYSEDYLPYVRSNLGTLFHIALSTDGMDVDDFSKKFVASRISKMISNGDPGYLAGRSGREFYGELFIDISGQDIEVSCGSEYWLGHTIAYLQWYWNVPFDVLERKVPMKEILAMYPTMHEADISKINELVGRRIHPEPFMRLRRKQLGYTQEDLSRMTGISLPTIRAYEQGSLSLSNAESEKVYRISKALGCSIEELILNNIVFR